MTEDLIAMARKAGAWPELSTTPKKDVEFLRRFAALIEARAVARTREECAKVCDRQAALWKHPKYHYAQAVGNHCAAAIRALGERT